MATEIIRANTVTAVNENKESTWKPFTELLASIGEVVEMYIGSPGSITSMEAGHRNRLTAIEKTEADADIMGLR